MNKGPFLPLFVAAFCLTLGACNTKDNSESDVPVVPAFVASELDSAVRPCDDFDSFANDTWKKNNPIPNTESRWGAFSILDKENKEVRIKGIIDEISAKTDLKKGTEEQQIADYYKSFLDTATIEKRGSEPLKPYLDKISAIKTPADYIAVSGEFQKFGVTTFVGFGVEGDLKNSKINALYGGQDGLSLGERGFYDRQGEKDKSIRDEFVKHIDNMFKLAGFTETNPGKTILDLETNLAKHQLTNVELRDPVKTYNKVAWPALKSLAPEIDWDTFAKNQGIKADSIIVQNKPYLTESSKILSSTPISTWQTYARWNLLSRFASFLRKDLAAEDFHFFRSIMLGQKEDRPRPERAIRSTDASLGMPLGKLFAKKYFPEESKEKVSEMIENVRKVYGQRIDSLSWMSDATKAKAKEKLKAFTYKIGYPDKWKDYSSIDIQPDKLVENVISVALYNHNEDAEKVGKPVDKTEWHMTPQIVNAYYNPIGNEVVFPAGILQPPFFNKDADDAINYGGIIAVIGHEFTHGFDDQGSQFDAEGNLKNWWTPKDRQAFEKLATQYADYFNKMEALPGLYINGRLTLGENIADLGGLTLAYNALRESFNGKEPEPIDGLSWKQRFFLGWAQVWRMNIREEAERNQVQTDSHSPAHARINGPLKQMAEFESAWTCSDSAKMGTPPTARIVIW